jgi:hypothetical protein
MASNLALLARFCERFGDQTRVGGPVAGVRRDRQPADAI